MSEKSHRHFLPILLYKQLVEYTVPDGYKARISAGRLGHITGTISALSLHGPQGTFFLMALAEVAAATGSANFELSDRILTNFVHSVDLTNLWFPERFYLALSGAATVSCQLLLELVPLDEA